jgi:hypothetical protein
MLEIGQDDDGVPIQVCYALATDGERRYVDLVAISALAVKRIHPRAKITVLTDDRSLPAISSLLEPSALAENVRSVGAYLDGSAGVRSRFIKTQVRQFIDGDFLCLDADAIPVAAFMMLFQGNEPLCAAIDRSPEMPGGNGFPSFAAPAFERLGWPQPSRFYLNSGVVLWKDRPITRQLGRLWHENWARFFRESNDFADQPAFNYSMDLLGISPGIMDDKFNARVGVAAEFARDACIYHFYASGPGTPGSVAVEELLERFRGGARLDKSAIDAAIVRSHRPVSSA